MFALLKHPLVDCDFEEAALHYALRDAGLAERFIPNAAFGPQIAQIYADSVSIT